MARAMGEGGVNRDPLSAPDVLFNSSTLRSRRIPDHGSTSNRVQFVNDRRISLRSASPQLSTPTCSTTG
jgi:hypothetical protein